ncbi:hypothetical protein D9615_005836 [Tricholomella constricta]|uniref:Uncharacterized protein n=1 Tax=Tricholomella constricta TaxID=117010 RepID=A0A8H5HAJ4_9AGAR|nr:hypothetical protein D9615_005836 [Tricholomella constricta]
MPGWKGQLGSSIRSRHVASHPGATSTTPPTPLYIHLSLFSLPLWPSSHSPTHPHSFFSPPPIPIIPSEIDLGGTPLVKWLFVSRKTITSSTLLPISHPAVPVPVDIDPAPTKTEVTTGLGDDDVHVYRRKRRLSNTGCATSINLQDSFHVNEKIELVGPSQVTTGSRCCQV